MQNPVASSPTSKPSIPRTTGCFAIQVLVIALVAALLATLYTAWTPSEQTSPGSGQVFPTAIAKSTVAPPGGLTATPHSHLLIGVVAGHYQNDSGAVCGDGLQEVEVNLKIATLVQKMLTDSGYDVDLLQEFDPRLTGYKAAALISIHADSCDYVNNEATGFKVSSAMATRHPERANRLTACIRNRYALATKLPEHPTSVTIDMTSYHAFEEIDENTPATIIETGFLNLDRQFLTQHPDLAAQGIAAGIICYIRNESITPPTPATTP